MHGPAFIVRARNPVAALSAFERTVREVAPELRPTGIRWLRPRLVSKQIEMVPAPQRFGATLLSGFAILALCVAAVGISDGDVGGIVSYEGVRDPQGAQPRDILSAVLLDTAVAVAAGIGLGIRGAAFATKLMQGLLYHVAPSDPISFFAATGVVFVIAIIAAIIPSCAPFVSTRCEQSRLRLTSYPNGSGCGFRRNVGRGAIELSPSP